MDLTNHFLLSMPGLSNSWFDRTITYLFEHNEDGAFGFVINRPAALLAGEVYDQLEIECISPADRSAVVYEGGPVDKERGFVLIPSNKPTDKPGDKLSNKLYTDAQSCTEGCGVTLAGSTDILTEIGNGNGPDDYLLLLGYAGWDAGQLEDEMANNSWLTCEASQEILFADDVNQKFNLAASTLGIQFDLISSEAGHA